MSNTYPQIDEAIHIRKSEVAIQIYKRILPNAKSMAHIWMVLNTWYKQQFFFWRWLIGHLS